MNDAFVSVELIFCWTSFSIRFGSTSVTLGWWKGRGWELFSAWRRIDGDMEHSGFKALLLTVSRIRFWDEQKGWWR